MTPDLLVTLSDSNYFDQARQLFSSVYHNSGWKGDYMVLAHDMEGPQEAWFRKRGIIVKSIFDSGSMELPNHPRTVLGKFHLFESGMEEWGRIIYLDADTTVTASLDRLTDHEGFQAVVDFHDMPLRGQFKVPGKDVPDRGSIRAFTSLRSNYDLDSISFNSGVMAFDGSMTGGAIYERLMELYREYEPIILHDQSILNLMFYKDWERLPLVFNNYYLYSRRPNSIYYSRCDGIVNHYILDRVWRTKSPHHYPEWKRNLDLSDGIDLTNRPGPSDIWDDRRIIETSRDLESSEVHKSSIKGRILAAALSLDRGIGKIGLMVKRMNPRLYESIRRKDKG